MVSYQRVFEVMTITTFSNGVRAVVRRSDSPVSYIGAGSISAVGKVAFFIRSAISSMALGAYPAGALV